MSYKKIHAFGLDISDYSLEIVLLDKKKKIKLALREKIPFGVVTNWKIKDKQALTEILLQLKEKAGKKLFTENVILSLPENKVFAHVFNIPKQLANNTKVILQLAQEQIPLDLNSAIFDYQIIKDQDVSKKERKIYFVAVEESLVFDYLEVLTSAKLKPIAIDIEPNGIARALMKPQKKLKKLPKENKKPKKKLKKGKKDSKSSEKPVQEIIKQVLPKASMILDIGAKHSMATIFDDSHIFPSISMPIWGHTFTQIIQKNLKSKDFNEAQKIKNKLKLNSNDYKKIQPEIEAELDKIIKEIKNLITYFQKNNDFIIENLYLSWGSSKFVGLFDYLKANFSIECKQAETIINSSQDIDTQLYLNAIGLALRGISKDPVTSEINLLPIHQKRILIEQQAKTAIIYSSLTVLFVSTLLIAAFNIVLSNLYFELDGLEKANTSFQKLIEGKRYQEIQAQIQEINDNSQLAKQTVNQEYSLKQMYVYFQANLPKTIVLNQFSHVSQDQIHKIKINGFALEREDVLELQEIIKNTPFYTNVAEPVSNFLKQKDIYFFFSFDFDFTKFQEYLIEEERKAKEKALKKAEAELHQSATQETANSPVSENVTWSGTTAKGTPAFTNKTWPGSAPNVPIQKDLSAKPLGTIIDLEENLIKTEDLNALNEDTSQLSQTMEETENIEDKQIEEILKNSNNEYPFQEKIHEKVGDIFVIEQKFYPAEESKNAN